VTQDKNFADRAIYRVLIEAPIETVWSELIKTTSPRPFFWNASWDANDMSPGNAYRMVSIGGKRVGVVGKILELDPPHRLVLSFRLTALDDPASIITYTLKATEDCTEFCLVTENVVAGSKSEKSMADGSKFIVNNIKAYVETGKVTFGARIMLAMYRIMAPLAPKSMNAENWPLDRTENPKREK
jgi:uncharacterized protein YndB with AHSA1/START domain